jgi:hypothetical protein
MDPSSPAQSLRPWPLRSFGRFAGIGQVTFLARLRFATRVGALVPHGMARITRTTLGGRTRKRMGQRVVPLRGERMGTGFSLVDTRADSGTGSRIEGLAICLRTSAYAGGGRVREVRY